MREALGFDARELTPRVVRKIVVLGGETRSFKRAVIALKEADVDVCAKTVQRVVRDVGGELVERRDAPKPQKKLAKAPNNIPQLAVVECDGGRIRTRQPGHGPGVHLDGKGWKETKNACFIRAARTTLDDDPQAEPPDCFLDPQHVAKIAETETLSVAAPPSTSPAEDADHDLQEEMIPFADWRPKRQVRTVLASMACSDVFGQQMQREAKQRRFFEAPAKVFLGDGLPWNWSIQKKHFRDFVAILDFIHPLSYLFTTAKALYANEQDVWDQYIVWMTGCWRGEVAQVLNELEIWQTKIGEPPAGVAETDPRQVLSTTLGYLNNNPSRMNYAEFRKQGLPITTAWMESLVKEVNYRVKGTEMYWNNPEGGEAILQVRAGGLCEDDRLTDYLNTRPGCAFTRKPKSSSLTAEKSKS